VLASRENLADISEHQLTHFVRKNINPGDLILHQFT